MSDTSELTGRALDVPVAEKLFGWRAGRPAWLATNNRFVWCPPDAFEGGTPDDLPCLPARPDDTEGGGHRGGSAQDRPVPGGIAGSTH